MMPAAMSSSTLAVGGVESDLHKLNSASGSPVKLAAEGGREDEGGTGGCSCGAVKVVVDGGERRKMTSTRKERNRRLTVS